MNICTFIGEVVDEPKRGTYGQGKTLLSWRMHVKHGQEPYERSCFVSFKAFSRVADSLPYLDTGATVAVTGYLEIRKDEQDRYWTTIIANDARVISGGAKPAKPKRGKQAYGGGGFDDGFSDNDIPF